MRANKNTNKIKQKWKLIKNNKQTASALWLPAWTPVVSAPVYVCFVFACVCVRLYVYSKESRNLIRARSGGVVKSKWKHKRSNWTAYVIHPTRCPSDQLPPLLNICCSCSCFACRLFVWCLFTRRLPLLVYVTVTICPTRVRLHRQQAPNRRGAKAARRGQAHMQIIEQKQKSEKKS